jgi:chemotaxis signal transduction protein
MTSSIEFGCNIKWVHVLSSKKQELIFDGRILHNGKEIQVYYMGDILKLKPTTQSINNRILLFESDEGQFGIGIDEILEILPLDENIICHEIISEKESENKFLLGKIYFEGRTIILPNFDNIINSIRSLQNVSQIP